METLFTSEELEKLHIATVEYRVALKAKADLEEQRRSLRLHLENLGLDAEPIQIRINKAVSAIYELLGGGIPTIPW